MSWHEIGGALKDYGLPLAMLLILAITGARKLWTFGWVNAEKDQVIAQVRAEKEEEIKRERARADWWQQRCLDQSSMLDRSIELAMRGVQSKKQGG